MHSPTKYFPKPLFCLPTAALGAALLVSSLLGGVRPAAADPTLLHQFSGENGAYPYGLIQGQDGSFYGVTAGGGSKNDGEIFRLTAQGTLIKLINFNLKNGSAPAAGLTQAPDGSFYGVTEGGGAGANKDNSGYGTVFHLTTDGTAAGTTLTTLYSFTGSDSINPATPLLRAADGSFYGTTSNGGDNGQAFGTIYRVVTDGTAAGTVVTTLYSFAEPGTYGYEPVAPLVQAADGSFYGTTYTGGGDQGQGSGTVFHLTTDGTAAGTTLTNLYIFSGPDGYAPNSLLPAPDGSFYGTTNNGGVNSDGPETGDGTVFHLTTDGTAAGTTLTRLYSFSGPDGAVPATLLPGPDGAFYGYTVVGGSGNNGEGYGTIFRLHTDGTAAGSDLTTLAVFNNGDGAYLDGLLLATDGALYGTAELGGLGGSGVVFTLAPAPSSTDPIESLTLTPATLRSGQSASGEVTLKKIATAPVTVALSSDNDSALSARLAVTVTPGHRHAYFTVQAGTVKASVTVHVTAAADGRTRTASVTVTP